MNSMEIGRLLRSDVTGCVVGCWVSQLSVPAFGGLVRIELGGSGDYSVYGMIHDIRIEDDGLVRQLLSAGQLDEDVIQDNRMNRNVPVEISVLFAGYEEKNRLLHLLPPRPPLILDAIFNCTAEELCNFTAVGFGYLRHLLRATDLPVDELLAAHLQMAELAHKAQGDPLWVQNAVQELIRLLRDDYSTLMNVLGALSDARLTY